MEQLDEERHDIARKSAFYRLVLEQFDLPYLQEMRKKVQEQEYFEQQIQKLQQDALEIGLTLTWPKPYSLTVIMEKEIVIAQIQKSQQVYAQERMAMEESIEDVTHTEQPEISQEIVLHDAEEDQLETSKTVYISDEKEMLSKQEMPTEDIEKPQEYQNDGTEESPEQPSKQQSISVQKIFAFVILVIVAIILWFAI